MLVGMPNLKRPDTTKGGLEEVEAQYRKERDGKLKERLNAIRLLMKGRTRKDVAEIIGVSESAITRWRRRWDEFGREGLKSRHRGRASKVTPEMRAEIEDIFDIRETINGRKITAIAIRGHLKKNTD